MGPQALVAAPFVPHWAERVWALLGEAGRRGLSAYFFVLDNARMRATLDEIAGLEQFDLATLSVALRTLRTVVQQGS